MLQMVRGLVRVHYGCDVTLVPNTRYTADIEGFQMRREMSSDSEDSYISELSDSDHEERKVEEEESSVRIASSVCGTKVTSQINSRGILTARFEYHFLEQNGSTSIAHKIFRYNPKNLKLRNRVFQTIYFSTVLKKKSCHMHFILSCIDLSVSPM